MDPTRGRTARRSNTRPDPRTCGSEEASQRRGTPVAPSPGTDGQVLAHDGRLLRRDPIGLWLFEPMAKLYEQVDTAIMRWIASWRFGRHSPRSEGLARSPRWVLRALRWGTIIPWSCAGGASSWCSLARSCAEEALAYHDRRGASPGPPPRRRDPLAVAGPLHAVAADGTLAVTLVGMAYSLIPHGRYRDHAKWVIGGILLVAAPRTHVPGGRPPAAAVFGAVLGVAIGLTAFRWFVPNDVFPVSYRRGKTAHLDVTGLRAEAIGTAVRDQLGYQVLDIKPVAWRARAARRRLRVRSIRPGARRRRRARPRPRCSRSSTRRTTSAPTAGTSSAARSCTAPWRTRLRSAPCGDSSSTRTTRCG